MGLSTIDEFSFYFRGGAKSYLFEWIPNAPASISSFVRDYKYLVRSTSIPSTTIEEITVNYQQVDFKMGGKKIFDDWVVSFNVDKDANIRVSFEEWSNLIHSIENGFFNHKLFDNYTSNESFHMLNGKGETILNITLYHAWPKSISPITLDYSSQDFAQFDVTFSYMYHEIKK